MVIWYTYMQMSSWGPRLVIMYPQHSALCLVIHYKIMICKKKKIRRKENTKNSK